MKDYAGTGAVNLSVAEPLPRVEALDYTRWVGYAAVPAGFVNPLIIITGRLWHKRR